MGGYEQDFGYKYFVPHEEVFKRGDPDQNVLIKYTLPIEARKDALQYLEKVGLDHYHLFQTEDALLKTLAIREVESVKNNLRM